MHPACACAPWFWNGELVGRAQWSFVALRRLTDRTLDLDTLEVLVRVAETGSLTRAAEVLGVTQQAVSARLRAAEQAVGQPLALRAASGTALTDAGRAALADGHAVAGRVLQELFAPLDAGERARLSELLEVLTAEAPGS